MAIKDRKGKYFFRDAYKKANQPLLATLELTYRCPLHCEHCYTGCYNYPRASMNELSTRQVKTILDKCRDAGISWLCLTGGDPLVRKDFAELYIYAKKLGFITLVFTSLTSLGKSIVDAFKKYPPYRIETTLNAATPRKYREITGTDLFYTQLNNIRALRKMGIVVEVKTQMTRHNVSEINEIEKLVESLGIKFHPFGKTVACLNYDTHPCRLRIKPDMLAQIYKRYGCVGNDNILRAVRMPTDKKPLIRKIGIFSCPVTCRTYITISVQGKMCPCISMRKPEYDLLKKGSTVACGISMIYRALHDLSRTTRIKCKTCKYRPVCEWCPGAAYLETGVIKPIKYFCRLAIATSRGR